MAVLWLCTCTCSTDEGWLLAGGAGTPLARVKVTVSKAKKLRWWQAVTGVPGAKVQWPAPPGHRALLVYCFSVIATLINLGCPPITAFKIIGGSMKYRTKTVVVEAVQVTLENFREVAEAVGAVEIQDGKRPYFTVRPFPECTPMAVELGDYLMPTRFGGFMGAKARLFEEEYEPA